METIIGAGIALLGVVISRWLDGRRDAYRLRVERMQAAVERNYTSRRDAHIALIEACDRALVALAKGPEVGGDSEATAEVLSTRLSVVRIFGSPAAGVAAARAVRYVLDGDLRSKEVWAAPRAKLEEYVAAVRTDLGVDEGPPIPVEDRHRSGT